MTETDLHRAVGRVDGRDEHVDKRLGAVEKKQAWYSGAAAADGAIVAVLVKH